ncbi:Amino acid transporter [Pseudomonas sp. NFIX10]|uniref:APC family permease n=1 Tax=unclassified Pseudomonas TaxID=196821 RepID=UPI0008E40252|nr:MULTISPECIES: APC family permease [unclassified Pseudomonas]SFB01396.1 Amino acid transporter [Pseudomonas sp. NFIX10]SFE54956.1 Amino acid transporter [Pseudomonas sp. NFACC06-1]
MQNHDQKNNLKTNSLGVSDIVFFVVSAAAPLGATLGGSPAVFAIGGSSAPSLYLCASVILMLFAIGFAAMSRYVVSAGGFAELVRVGIGSTVGHAASGIAILAYICMLAGIYGAFSAFNSELVKNYTGIDFSWQLSALSVIVIVGIFGYLDVNISAKVLGVLMILEVLILVVFDIAVLTQADPAAMNFANFIPKDFSAPGLGVALMFAFSCFVGFESTTIYGEEAKNPHTTIPLATYIAIALIGVFYTLSTWCLSIAYSGSDVQAVASGDLINFVFNMNTKFVGLWSTQLMQVLAVTSLFAVLLSFHNALCRYLFALARSNFLFNALSRVHSKNSSPHVASLALSVITSLILLVFMLAGADPIGNIFMWMVALGTLAILVLQSMGAIAVIAYFKKTKQGFLWQGLIAPLLGGAGLIFVVILALTNFHELTGSKSELVGYLPWLVPIAAAVGIINGKRKAANYTTNEIPTSA